MSRKEENGGRQVCGRKEGRKGGRGRKEGRSRKEGRKEGRSRKEGRPRKEGRKRCLLFAGGRKEGSKVKSLLLTYIYACIHT